MTILLLRFGNSPLRIYSQHTNEGMLSDTCKCASNCGSNYIITVDDVSKAVQNIKLRKFCGPDGLAPEAIMEHIFPNNFLCGFVPRRIVASSCHPTARAVTRCAPAIDSMF